MDREVENKNRPSGSAFKQQKLPAWQPILTAGTVIPTFFLIGITFIPIGFGLIMSSNGVQEIKLDYTDCINSNLDKTKTCAEIVANPPDPQRPPGCQCIIDFKIDKPFEKDVFVYYGLTNFFQNHRRYVRSRDDKQLLGEFYPFPASDCDPYDYILTNQTDKRKGKPIVPCGAIANSLFNDTFQLKRTDQNRNNMKSIVPILETGIAWYTDKNNKFRNPPGGWDPWRERFSKPPNWPKPIWDLGAEDKTQNNTGLQNEKLIVWMRTAALPTFRKLYGRINHGADPILHQNLPKGDYSVTIDYNYPVTAFKGTKRFIISTTSWMGGKNTFLGLAYVGVGFLCLVLTVVFLFIHKRYGKE